MATAKVKTPEELEAEKKAKLEAEAAKATKSVRVICEGVLGPLGLKKGDVTDDKDYVALLKVTGQTKVEEVK